MKLAILHYLPLEYYPPITNLVDTINSEHSDKFNSLKIYSTNNIKRRKTYQLLAPTTNGALIIKRSPFPKETDNSIIRILKYIHFNLSTLINLLIYKPNSLLYFESYSAWPTYIYTKYFNRKCKLFIHYHEYASKDWYNSTMKQVKYFHKIEKKWLYPHAQWISQTNADRLQFFHHDHPYLKEGQLKIMPNYPSTKWSEQHKINNTIANVIPLKIVYVGSLSLKNTYIKELCEWVAQQNGKILFDIYSYNIDKNTSLFLESLESEFISYYKDGIEYNDIPKVLTKYDIGIILYKAYSDNVINCVSNKFYEYYACGLDIWFSKTMKSTYQHINPETYPRVIPIDFTRLKYFNWQKAANKNGLQKNEETFYCEDVYEKLVDELVK